MSFFIDVQKGKISSPVYKSYSEDQWETGYSKNRKSADCDRVYKAGKIVYHLLDRLRAANSMIPTWCTSEKHILYLLGLCNRDTVTLSKITDDGFEGKKDPFINDLEHFKVPLSTGAMAKPDEVNSSSMDALTTVIQDVLSNTTAKITGGLPEQLKVNFLIAQLNLCNTYQWIESVWRDCLWNGYGFTDDGESGYIIEPQSDEAHMIAKITAATDYRRRMFRHNHVGLLGEIWKNDISNEAKTQIFPPKVVTSITGSGKSKVIRLSSEKYDKATDQAGFEAFATRELIQKEYYDEILFTPVPKIGGQTVETLFNVWLVLRSLSRATAERLPSASVFSPGTALSFGISYPRKEVVALLHRATNISVENIKILLDFLTFRKHPHTLWSQPLIEASEGRIALPFAALHQSEPLYVLECWLPMLSINVGAKGNPFEREVRSSLQQCAKSDLISPIFSVFGEEFTFHPNKRGERNEEIDLVFCLGNIIYIGEIKCSVVPVEDIQFYNNRNIISGAVDQAKRKADCVRRNMAAFVKQLRKRGFSIPDDAEIRPIVVSNNLINSGYAIGDTPVVDIPILERYLEGSITELSYNAGRTPINVTKFYNSSQEAELQVGRYFANPPQLRHIKAGLKFRELDIPANFFDAQLPRLTRREYEVVVDIEDVKKRLTSSDNVGIY